MKVKKYTEERSRAIATIELTPREVGGGGLSFYLSRKECYRIAWKLLCIAKDAAPEVK